MSKFIQRYLAEKISSQKMAGNLSRLSSVFAKSTIDLNPHQIHSALYAFNSPLSRGAILADEVGLGKTIEAGIIIAQLWAESKRKVLIICPASIRNQWQDELLTKFGLMSEVWDGPSFSHRVNSGGKTPLTYEGIFIASYQFVYSHLGLVQKQSWSVVVIDEAHRFRRVYRGRDASKMAYEIREIIKDKPKVLLTATPLQNNLEELYGIASFIDDKLLGTPYSFKTKFVDPLKEQSSIASVRLDELKKLLKGDEGDDIFSISGIITRTLRKQVLEYVPFTDRTSVTFDFTPTEKEVELYEKVSAYLQRPKVAAIVATQRNLMILVYRKLLASSSFAISATLKKLIENLKQELKLRNKKETIGTIFKDIDNDIFEEELEESELEEILKDIKEKRHRVDQSFTDETIKEEIKELEEYYSLAMSISVNTKGEELIKELQNLFSIAKKKLWPQKAIVFTESTRTQEYLSTMLDKAGISYTTFNGSNSSKQAREAFSVWRKEFPEAASVGSSSANTRQALIYNFKTKTQILLTTEAGAEGLNLQFCNIVINYDLPWNPQRVEQRIGRCHRYGQRYQVIVANFLNTKNYADKRVLELLQEKLNLFDGLFGSSDEILGAIESGLDFEKKILGIYQSCKTPEEYDKAFTEVQLKLKETISATTLEYRKLLLENADQTVADLFKKTVFETKQVISDFDNNLLRLCKESLVDKLKSTKDEAIYKVDGLKFPIAFRELKEDEIGKVTRIHKEHPLVKKVLGTSLSIQTKPIPSITLNLSKHGKIITQLNEYIGKSGFIYLWKLEVIGVENEEIIVPLVFIRKNDKFRNLDFSVAIELLTVETVENEKTYDTSPIEKDELIRVWNSWKAPVLEKYRKKNERLLDRETDRINQYYNDYTLRVENRIQKKEQEKADLNRRRDNSADMEERRNLLKRIQNIEISLGRFRIEQLKLRQQAEEKREKELKNIFNRLELEINEEMIAITHFILN